MGLDDSRFGNVVTAIIEADDLPDFGKTYAKVIREEARLKSSKARETSQEAIGFTARKESQPSESRETNFGSAQSEGSKSRDRVCYHSGKPGHEKSSCWKLVGYPEWITDKQRGRGDGRGGNRCTGRGYGIGGGRGTAHVATATSSYGSNSNDLTPEQWSKITQIIQEGKLNGGNDKLSGNILGDVIIDTCASHHMTGKLSQLVNIRDMSPCLVGFVDGGITTSTSMGDLVFSETISLNDVLYVPKLDCTLILVSKLLKHINCFALFTDAICLLQDHSSKILIGADEEHDRVYYFKDVSMAKGNKTQCKVDQVLWHQRLGHPAFSVFLMVSGVRNNVCSSLCDICFRAKQTRDVFFKSCNKTTKCFELIHVDVWGPYRVLSSSGAVYFLTIVDDYSRAVWTYLLVAKSEVQKVVERFCKYTEKQFGKSVQMVRSDNGLEFMSLSTLFADNEIIHQTTCVYTPQQNGRVELKHRHILNVARAMLFQAQLFVKFWGEPISSATHVTNMTP